MSPEEETPPSATPPRAEEPAPVAPPAAASPDEDWGNRYRYLLAEFDNYRKRVERERDQIRTDARAAVLRKLLPLQDALDQARTALSNRSPEDPIRRGLELLAREWQRFWSNEGVTPVARPGGRYSEADAEVVGELPATDDAPDGTVAAVVQQGYRGGGFLLRPAKVLLARAGRADTSKPPEPVDPATPE